MITFEVVRGAAQGQVFAVDAPRFTIGRAPGNQVVLADYHLSGEHGQVFREEDQYFYLDLRSTNGSRLQRAGGEVALDARGTPLRDGDLLQLGDPTEPVVLACRVTSDAPVDESEVHAQRNLGEVADLEARVENDPKQFRALYEASKKLGGSGLVLKEVFESIAQSVFELIAGVDNIAIDLLDRADGRPETLYFRTRAGSTEPFKTSRSVVRRVLRERAAVWMSDRAQPAAVVITHTSDSMATILNSILAVPLWQGDAVRGVIQCDNRTSGALFSGRHLDLLLVLAGQWTLAIENARLFKKVTEIEEQLRDENKLLKKAEEKRRFSNIIGESPAMREIFRQLDKVIDTRATVCIEGETGTGKELIASAIHYQGKRKDKLFVAQNCAAVPENLLESELFGHRKGAFTGADYDKKGLFEIADGGTLFLDEIGEMSLGLQAKLLRVLQEGKVRPVGASQERAVDVRIICATNRSLDAEVERGAFRQDLYYRLKVFPLRLPPLRERREDILPLALHFLDRYRKELGKEVGDLTPEAEHALVSYGWPGNIREVENEMQRLIIQADPEAFITPEMLSPQIRKVEGLLGRIAPKKGTLKDMVEEVERWLLAESLREHGGNKTKTAETLGITREGLHKKLAKYGM